MPDEKFTQLESQRLIVRRFKDSDLEPFLAYRADPDVARYQDWEDYSRADAEKFFERVGSMNPNVPGEWFQCAVEIKATGEMIGDMGLLTLADDPRQVTMGIYLERGVGLEASRYS